MLKDLQAVMSQAACEYTLAVYMCVCVCVRVCVRSQAHVYRRDPGPLVRAP